MSQLFGAVCKESVFAYELSNIKSVIHNEIAKVCIDIAPDYFWVMPASTTGKYHPKSSLGIGGLVRHTKSVMEIAEIYLGHPQNDDLSQEDKDDIRVACMIHDMVKLGDNSTGYTVHEHPMLVRTMLCPYNEQDENTPLVLIDTWNRICDLVDSHMGIWNTNKYSETVLPVPQTRKQSIVHMADYMASRKNISVEINSELPKTATTTVEDHKATQKQIDYITLLVKKCTSTGVTIPEHLRSIQLKDASGVITVERGKASDAIKELKELLGIEG